MVTKKQINRCFRCLKTEKECTDNGISQCPNNIFTGAHDFVPSKKAYEIDREAWRKAYGLYFEGLNQSNRKRK